MSIKKILNKLASSRGILKNNNELKNRQKKLKAEISAMADLSASLNVMIVKKESFLNRNLI